MKTLNLILILLAGLQVTARPSLVKLSNASASPISFVRYDEYGSYKSIQIGPGKTVSIPFDQEYLNVFSLENGKNVPYFFFPGDEVEITQVNNNFYSFGSKNAARVNELEAATAVFKLIQSTLNSSEKTELLLTNVQLQLDSYFVSDKQQRISSEYIQLLKKFYFYHALGERLLFAGEHKELESFDQYWEDQFNYSLQSYILTFRRYALTYLPKFFKKENLLQEYHRKFRNDHREIAMYTVVHMAYYRDKEWFTGNYDQYNKLVQNKDMAERISYFKLTNELLKLSDDVILMNTEKDTVSLKSTLARLKGKVVLIDLWASWCAPCIEMMPFSENLSKEYDTKLFQVLYLSLDRELKLFSEFSDKNLKGKLNYNIIGNFNSSFAQLNKINTIPRYMLVDKQGNFVNTQAPFPNNDALKEMIEKLF